MKKITLLLAFFVITTISAQQTISFESSESYTLGDINGQNGWYSTGDGTGGFVENQIISDEMSSDGSQSLKVTVESAFPSQQSPVVGGFYDYASPVDHTDATISFDIYMQEDQTATSQNNYRFGISGEGLDENGQPAQFFITIIDFNFQNNIRLVDNDGYFVDAATWDYDTWYNFRIELSNGQAEFFLDDSSIGMYNLLTETDITGARIVHDNYGGNAYFDNFRTNDEELSNNKFKDIALDYFVNNNTLTINTENAIDQIEIYNMLGQSVKTLQPAQNSANVDLGDLNSGMFISKVTIEGKTQTFKFVK